MKGRGSAIREIKARLNILDVVKRYVDLRRVGNRWVAPCPFHQETKPSFSVNEDEGFFYCFGCQAAGDLFDFYGRINGLEFRETLEQLAEEAGVILSDVRPDPKAAAERDFKKIALRMYETAKNHFRRNLYEDNGLECRNYLERRKLSPEIIESFELGWSLPGWQGLADALRRSGFTQGQGVEAGLLIANERGGCYDRFRGRLIFPIKNLSGQVIAFGGRIIGGEDSAKYINSSDSPLYKKGDNLYGLFQARRGIAIQKSVIITEGYMDVLTLRQFGYSHACGVLGTALTAEQVRRLAGFCSSMELIFDGDAPGRKAALKACEMVMARGLACKVVILPEGEDIDSLLHEQGTERFEELRRFAPEGLDFCVRMLQEYAPKEALDWVKNFLAAFEQPELVLRYASRLTQGLDLDEREVRKALPAPAKGGRQVPPSGPKAAGLVKKDALDRWIMHFLVRYPHHLPVLRDSGAQLLLTQGWALCLWEKMAACAPEYDPSEVLRGLDDKEKEFWGRCRVMEAPPAEHQEEELHDIRALVERRCREKSSGACMQALRRGGDKGDYDADLLKALNETLIAKRETLIAKRTRGSSDG
ncbi:MAG: DNA primase [Desulfovibrio sp.]|nr:DNA primase [Desulfovibrio sp.]